MCGAWQLSVCAIGLTCLDHCQPGWNVARPTGPASMLTRSSVPMPASNGRVSSGASRLLRIIPAIAATPQGHDVHATFPRPTLAAGGSATQAPGLQRRLARLAAGTAADSRRGTARALAGDGGIASAHAALHLRDRQVPGELDGDERAVRLPHVCLVGAVTGVGLDPVDGAARNGLERGRTNRRGRGGRHALLVRPHWPGTTRE